VTATASSRFTVPNYWADTKTGVSYSLQVQVPQGQMQAEEDLLNVPVTAGAGKTALLRNVAKVEEGSVVGQYDRYNMARMVSVTANIQGSDLGTVSREVDAALGALEKVPGVSVTVRGQIKPFHDLEDGLKSGLWAAVLVVLLVLTANFQSWRLALVVVSAVPAVLVGVVLALWLTGVTINLQSFMGAIMAIGVSISNAILFVTFADRAHQGGASRTEAAVESIRGRARPILMTSFAMMAGMVPMATGGTASEPLGRAVLGGLFLATVATLFLLPAVYALGTRKRVYSASLDPDDEPRNLPEDFLSHAGLANSDKPAH
jgi:multidrug efflux pump subunit AcrB